MKRTIDAAPGGRQQARAELLIQRRAIIHADFAPATTATTPIGSSYQSTFTRCAPRGSETPAGWTRYYKATDNPAGVTCPRCRAAA